jgi:hypothetical protein
MVYEAKISDAFSEIPITEECGKEL